MYAYEMYAYEMYAYEMYAYEMYAYVCSCNFTQLLIFKCNLANKCIVGVSQLTLVSKQLS
jgi:hypothetical protein